MLTAISRQLFNATIRIPKQQSPSTTSIFFRTRFCFHSFPAPRPSSFQIEYATRKSAKTSTLPLLFQATGVAGVGLGLCLWGGPQVCCDAPSVTTPSNPRRPEDLPPPPGSSLSIYQLSFGTVTGICAGVFIKKGAKAVAWFLGGIFVLLQYLSSASIVRVDWRRVASRFENSFNTADTAVSRSPPTISAVWTWLVNFLTADFQPRASFLAGLALGLRIG